MDIQYCWCKHCGIRYSHQFSGPGCFNQLSSRDYCDECNLKIKEALSTIPKKVYTKFFEYLEFSEDIKELIFNEFNYLKNTRIIWIIIDFKSYIPIKINHPNSFEFRKITVYCSSDKSLLCEGRFRIEDNKLIYII